MKRFWIKMLALSALALTLFIFRQKLNSPPIEISQNASECMSHSERLAGLVRQVLYKNKNDLADHMDQMNWLTFCSCYPPKLLVLKKKFPTGQMPSDQYQSFVLERDQLIHECAILNTSNPEAQKVAPAHTPETSLTPNPDFDNALAHCRAEPKGYFMNAEIYLRSLNSPRAEQVSSLDSNKYCVCYINSLRNGLGDELALQEVSSLKGPSQQDILKVAKVKDATFEKCVAEQIPLKN